MADIRRTGADHSRGGRVCMLQEHDSMASDGSDGGYMAAADARKTCCTQVQAAGAAVSGRHTGTVGSDIGRLFTGECHA